MTLSELEWLSEIFSDTKRRAVSQRQLSFFLSAEAMCTENAGSYFRQTSGVEPYILLILKLLVYFQNISNCLMFVVRGITFFSRLLVFLEICRFLARFCVVYSSNAESLSSLSPLLASEWLRPGRLQARAPVSNQHSARGILIGCSQLYGSTAVSTCIARCSSFGSRLAVLRCSTAAVPRLNDAVQFHLPILIPPSRLSNN